MTGLVVVLLTIVPVAVCGYVGSRLGGRRLARGIVGLLIASACGTAVGFGAMRAGWAQPFGLLTTAVAALLSAGVAWALALRWSGVGAAGPSTSRARVTGAGLGSLYGVVVAAALWIAATLGEGVVSAAPAAAEASAPAAHGWAHALVRTANRGFVTHIPVLGRLGDEVEATVAILNASIAARRELAKGRRWDTLTKLASYRAILADEDAGRDLEAVANGSVMALYRLQRNRVIIAFMQEPEVRALVTELRPSAIARELEAIERATVAR